MDRLGHQALTAERRGRGNQRGKSWPCSGRLKARLALLNAIIYSRLRTYLRNVLPSVGSGICLCPVIYSTSFSPKFCVAARTFRGFEKRARLTIIAIFLFA